MDCIQAAEGVIDVKLQHAWHKPAGGTYSEFDMWVNSVAGHFVIDQVNSSWEYLDETIVNIEA